MKSKRIGVMLKRLRQQKGLTQVELAKKAKLTQFYLAKMETGDKTNPSVAILLQRLAKALKVPVTELLR